MYIDPSGGHWYYLWIDDLLEYLVQTFIGAFEYGIDKALDEYREFTDSIKEDDPFSEVEIPDEITNFIGFIDNNPIVLDISVSVSSPNGKYVKTGFSYITSFNSWYYHLGGGAGSPSIFPFNVSIGFGMANNVNRPQDYSGSFFDLGVYGGYGYDHCWWPGGSCADSFTINTNYGFYIG